MKFKYTTLITAVVAALGAQFALVQTAAAAGKYECYEEAVEPKPASTKGRDAVKADIGGKGFSCYEEAVEPKAKSMKDRAKVKAETKAAVKAGQIPSGEAMTKKP